MLTLSIITCVLIIGRFSIKFKEISFLKVALSRAYKTLLESTKKSAFIGFNAVKFKVSHINTVFLPKFKSLFNVVFINHFGFNRKRNNFHLSSNEFFRKFNDLMCVCRYDKFSVHIYKNKGNQIYKISKRLPCSQII